MRIAPLKLTDPQWRALGRASKVDHVYAPGAWSAAKQAIRPPWLRLRQLGLVDWTGAGFRITLVGRLALANR